MPQKNNINYHLCAPLNNRSTYRFFLKVGWVLGIWIAIALPDSYRQLKFPASITPVSLCYLTFSILQLDWRFRRAKIEELSGTVVSYRLLPNETHVYLDNHPDLFVLDGNYVFEVGVDRLSLTLLKRDGEIVEFDHEWIPHVRPEGGREEI